MYCRSLLSRAARVSRHQHSLQCADCTRCATSRRETRERASIRARGAPRRRAGPGGIPRARVTVRPRGVSVSAHILSKDTNTSRHRAHILAEALTVNAGQHTWTCTSTQHPCTQQSVHAQFAMPNKPTEGLGSRARLCFATPHARPQQPTRILVLSDAMNGGHVPY